MSEPVYCVHCRRSVPVADARRTTTKTGRARITGTCPTCRHQTSQFVKGAPDGRRPDR